MVRRMDYTLFCHSEESQGDNEESLMSTLIVAYAGSNSLRAVGILRYAHPKGGPTARCAKRAMTELSIILLTITEMTVLQPRIMVSQVFMEIHRVLLH